MGTGKLINRLVRVVSNGPTERTTMETIEMVLNMGTGSSAGLIRALMQVISIIIIYKAKVDIAGMTDALIKGTGSTTKCMAKESLPGPTDAHTTETI